MFSAETAPVRSLPELTEHFVQSLGLCRRDLSHLLLDHDGISDRLILHLVVDASSVQGIAYDVLPLEGESAVVRLPKGRGSAALYARPARIRVVGRPHRHRKQLKALVATLDLDKVIDGAGVCPQLTG